MWADSNPCPLLRQDCTLDDLTLLAVVLAGDDDEESEIEEETETEEVYEVEKILSHKGEGKTRKYLVKWEGWEEPTWEAACNLTYFENKVLTLYLKGLKASA